MNKWLTVSTVARELGMSTRSLYRLCSECGLITAKFRGSLRILAASVRHYQKARIAQQLLEAGQELPEGLAEEIENFDKNYFRQL
jgi:hypothetical protein